MIMADGGPVDALCGWFDVFFKGSQDQPTDCEVKLSTGPDPTGEPRCARVACGTEWSGSAATAAIYPSPQRLALLGAFCILA